MGYSGPFEATAGGPPPRGGGLGDRFEAQLVALDGRRLAKGRDFASDGRLKDEKLLLLDEQRARAGSPSASTAPTSSVRSVERKPYVRRPSAPFMTSTLQQEASRKLRFTSQRTMQVAQRLYENGYITYMRTDSTTLSEAALTAARDQARQLYGAEYVPEQPRQYERKVKNAQEAHEAIRPAGDTFRTPQQVERELGSDELRLYELIWMRTIASQMADAKGQTATIRIVGTSTADEEAEFGASGTVITFRGFLAAYEEGRDNGRSDEERKLPNLAEGDSVTATALEPQGHETTPPPRYTEATLVRALEERGIGRPSTYASIIGTILDRGYVFKKDSALVPSFLAFAVVGLLEQHFGRLVDYDFTARMEDDLDRIAAGDEERVRWLRRFYFGNGDEGLKDLVSDLGGIDAREVSSIDIGNGIVVRVGRYGPYLERDGRRAASRRTSSPTSSRSTRPRSCCPSPPTTARSAWIPPAGARSWPAPDATARTSPRCWRRARRRSRGRRRCSRACRSRPSRSRTPWAAHHSPRARGRSGGRRGGRCEERPLRAIRPEGQGVALARRRRAAAGDRPRGSARAALPAEERRRAERVGRRSAARARPGSGDGRSRSWSRTAASVHM